MPFSFGAMAVGGGNVAVGLGLGSIVVVNVVDVACPLCFCCVLGGGVVRLLVPQCTKATCRFNGISPFSILHNTCWVRSPPTPKLRACNGLKYLDHTL